MKKSTLTLLFSLIFFVLVITTIGVIMLLNIVSQSQSVNKNGNEILVEFVNESSDVEVSLQSKNRIAIVYQEVKPLLDQNKIDKIRIIYSPVSLENTNTWRIDDSDVVYSSYNSTVLNDGTLVIRFNLNFEILKQYQRNTSEQFSQEAEQVIIQSMLLRQKSNFKVQASDIIKNVLLKNPDQSFVFGNL